MNGLPDTLRSALDGAGLRPIDVALADWGWRHGGGRPGAFALALANHAIGLGHTCLPLDRLAEVLGEPARLVAAERFSEELEGNPLIAAPEAPESRPLVLEGHRLYLQRYWEYERQLAARIQRMLAAAPAPVETTPLGPDGGLFDYGWSGTGETNWQAVAAYVAQRHRFAVISGGPGTGKTYTILRLMIRLAEAALAAGERPPAFRLAAPTGKAAARMATSVRDGLTALDLHPETRQYLPDDATTLHRLLRLRWGSTTPGHDRDRPIPADAVIVDEASMIDLPLMSKLVDAIPETGRLILLGDRYQLASVESGAVLADLCVPAGINAFSDAQRTAAGALLTDAPTAPPPSALRDHVVTLQTSHRFRADSAIGRLAQAINTADAEALANALADGATVRALGEPDASTVRALVAELADAYDALHQAREPADALAALADLRLLTATRIGPCGSEALNQRIAMALAERHGFEPDARHYHGRPIIVTHNDHRAGLYNGDTGVIWHDGEGRVRAWFETEHSLRPFQLSALPAHATVYAMTIHKSQGSEFDTVYLLPAPADSLVLTRELLYTGATRARRRLVIAGTLETLTAGIHRHAARASGLADRIVAK